MTDSAKSNKGIGKLAVIVFAVGALIFLGKMFPITEWLRQALDWVANLGTVGAVFFILIYILSCVLFLPGSILTLGAGAVYGVLWGTLLVSAGSVLGATAAFIVGRYVARGWVAKQIDANPKFKSIDEAVAKEGWKIVGLTRLSPIFPFSLLNYAYGLTKVSLRDYFFASWIGMIPGTIMYVYIGSLANSLAMIGAEERTRTSGEWILYGVGLLATIAVTVYVTKVAKKALSEKVES